MSPTKIYSSFIPDQYTRISFVVEVKLATVYWTVTRHHLMCDSVWYASEKLFTIKQHESGQANVEYQ